MQLNCNIPKIIIVDDFYSDPDAVREMAITSEYYEPKHSANHPKGTGNWLGRNSKISYNPPNICQLVSKLTGKILLPAPGNTNGHFRLAYEGDESFTPIHHDVNYRRQGDTEIGYVGVLYLNTPDQCHLHGAGTVFYKHKATNYNATTEAIDSMLYNDIKNPDAWEVECSVEMRYNRFVLISKDLYHTPGEPFGNCPLTGRCVQLFNFFTVKTS